ncbi:MAG: o-succinylbenzoate--CoA ligase [SAR324 cluster bacterium]|nr:o-succinylbenzoate--CoA ligase [SAR324 cluster bacterium]
MNKLPCLLKEASLRFASLPAIFTHQKKISYSELEALVQGTQSSLLENGIKKGEVVSLVLPNSLECLVILLALFRMGGIAAPINIRFPEQQIRQLIDSLGGSCVVIPREKLHDYPGPIHAMVCEDLINSQNSRESEKILFDPEQPVTVVFTSGSSGDPKAALHSYKNHYFSALGSNENIPVGPGDRWLLSLPLFHVGGLAILFRTLLGGGTVVIPKNLQDLFQCLETYQITHASLVNTQLLRLLKEGRFKDKKTNLKSILLGGGPLSPELLKRACELNLPLFASYGSTEMSSQIATTPPGAPLKILKNAGKVLKYRSVKVAENGEVLVRGETLFLGYLSEKKLISPVDEEGWYHTGDRGLLKNDSLILLGRIDRMFISGGENVYPEEIERAFSSLPEVEQVFVVPVSDDEYGSRPAAFLKMKDSSKMTRAIADARLGRVLARYKIPDYFLPWPEEIENQGFKVNFKQMIEIARKSLNIAEKPIP